MPESSITGPSRSVGAAMPRAISEQPSPTFTVSGDGDPLALAGVLDIRTLAAAEHSLQRSLRPRKARALDLGNLTGLDSPDALFLCTLRKQGVKLIGVLDALFSILFEELGL
jgi:ABC-type transporter Mla MlaB component